MEIPKEKLLDNSDLYEIPEDRRQAIIDAPENDRKERTPAELDKAMKDATSLFDKWKGSISKDLPEGDRSFLEGVQTVVEWADRALAFKYDDVMGINRQMIFKPARLERLDKTTLENRLELQ